MTKPEGKYLNWSKEDRLKRLTETCDKTEDVNYQKEFTKTEILDMRKSLADEMIALSELQEELDNMKKEFKEKINPIENEVIKLVSNLKYGSHLVTEKCWKFLDRSGEKVDYYSDDGVLVHTRPATPKDLQLEIKHENGELSMKVE